MITQQDGQQGADPVDSVVSAASRFQSDLFRLRAELDRMINRARQGENISAAFDQLKVQAERAVASADAARRTPPSSRDVGLDSDRAGKLSPRDIMNMKQEDFNKLDEAALAKLRGDIA